MTPFIFPLHNAVSGFMVLYLVNRAKKNPLGCRFPLEQRGKH
uniref:Uncharacterized protein n=1 Tax=Anguilla anguilla TaxID=7936 RepID=A0A0E9VPD1_ANGAN